VTPAWLLEAEPGLCPCGCAGRRRRGSYLDQTVRGATTTLRQVLVNDEVAGEGAVLRRIDARVKLLSVLALLVATALVRHLPVLLAVYAVTLVGAAAARLPLGFFLRRVWLFVPLFTGIVVVPATFSFVTPGDVVVPLWHDGGLTRQGLTGAGLIVLRVAVSVSLVLLLTVTTRWTELLAALRSLRVPRTFVLVIGMTYRYLLVLLGVVADMHEARRSRVLAPRERSASGRRFVAGVAGSLLGRAHDLSLEIHQAMLARGFRGEVRRLDPPRIRPLDLIWLAGAVALAVAIAGGDHVVGA
jgi:cobalt/nickel transport system permease protein